MCMFPIPDRLPGFPWVPSLVLRKGDTMVGAHVIFMQNIRATRVFESENTYDVRRNFPKGII